MEKAKSVVYKCHYWCKNSGHLGFDFFVHPYPLSSIFPHKNPLPALLSIPPGMSPLWRLVYKIIPMIPLVRGWAGGGKNPELCSCGRLFETTEALACMYV